MTDDRFKLKPIPKDERLNKCVTSNQRYQKYKEMIRRDIAKGLIQPDQFNNKGKKEVRLQKCKRRMPSYIEIF